jgi:hypothetical protein
LVWQHVTPLRSKQRKELFCERWYNGDVIEATLGHQDEDEIRRAYNRSKYWRQRVERMTEWANLMDEFRSRV